MKTSLCSCGNRLFFHSVRCVRCQGETGLCPACRQISVLRRDAGSLSCGSCGVQVLLCQNQVQHDVCNQWVDVGSGNGTLCRFCRLTSVIPDLSMNGNRDRWRSLEQAKRRVLFGVEDIGFPIPGDDSHHLPLRFEFKADGPEPVATGHADGCITINLREADAVERERARVELNEPHRTLVGHFRHELGHYYWQLLVEPAKLAAFRRVFGDENNPAYAEAQQKYYAAGPRPDWQEEFVSAYASMHPWEDFAESFGAYLDMRAALQTARHFRVVSDEVAESVADTFDAHFSTYQKLGVAVNELNREMGLLDLVPEVFTPRVTEKLQFIHDLPHGKS